MMWEAFNVPHLIGSYFFDGPVNHTFYPEAQRREQEGRNPPGSESLWGGRMTAGGAAKS